MAKRRTGTRRAGRTRAPWWSRIMVGMGGLLMVLSLGSIGYTMVVLNAIDDAIEDKEMLPGESQAGQEIEGPLNILLVGADLRVGQDGKNPLSDTIIILHIDKDLDKATLVSIPRDLRVDIADCGPYFDNDPCTDKINASYSLLGPEVENSVASLATTLTSLTSVEFDGAVVINFEGFIDTVKTFGGIELCLSQDLYTDHGDGFYPKGCNRYDADDALSIVRERKNWEDGDYGRQRMQQHFIKQLLKEAEAQGYMSDPTKITTLIKEIGEQIVVDLRQREPVDFALALSGIKPGDMQTLKLPSHSQNIDGVSYVVVGEGTEEEQKAQALFAAIRDDTLPDWMADNPDFINKDPKT